MEYLLFCFFTLTILMGVPIAIVLGSTSVLAYTLISGLDLQLIPRYMFDALSNPIMIAVPLFVLTGDIITSGGIASRLIRIVHCMIGRMRGGLAVTTVLACMVFAAISGSSLTGIIAIGSIMYPALLKGGYSKRFSLGVITSSSSLGILIPPSVVMIIYAMIMSVSVTDLFIAGIIPGLMIGIGFILYSLMTAYRNDWRGGDRPSLNSVLQALKQGFWGLMLPLIIIGGIYGGVFTPTEAAAAAAVYALFVEFCIYRQLTLKKLVTIFRDSATLSACLLFVFACGNVFSMFLTMEQIPQTLSEHILSMIHTPWMFLVIVNMLLLFVGCFMDVASAMLIFGPIFYPILVDYGINLVHFGIVMILNLEVGFLTPPIGFNLYVSTAVTQESILEISRAVVPFIIVMLIGLIILTYIPWLSTALIQ